MESPRVSFTWPDGSPPPGFRDLQSDLETLIHKARTTIELVVYDINTHSDFLLNKAFKHVIKRYKPEIRIYADNMKPIDHIRKMYGGKGSRIRAWTWEKKGHDFSKMHIKSILVNGRHLYLGSANFSKSAMGVNAECGLFFDSKEQANRFRHYLELLVNSGRLVEV